MKPFVPITLSILVSIAGCTLQSPSGCFTIALPMKIKGGSGAPLRIIAMTQ